VNYGVTLFATDRTMPVHELAVAAEERGFHSVYVPEHTHIPVSRETPPATGTDELDEGYMRTLDPLVALAAAATLTRSILLGTAVALPAEHDPIAWAKAVATLDFLSGGRVALGVGYGWNKEELRDHGVAFADRRAVVRETMLLAQALWAEDVGGFEGEHRSVSPSWSWPKPVQRPRVRTLVGGAAGPKLFASIAEWGDGWIPFGGAGLKDALPELRRVVGEAGRDPDELHIVPMGVFPTPEKMDYYESLGVTECVLRVPAGGADQVLPVLDDYVPYLSR
jgi:probable F420-dependent oxidoreductase